MVDLVEEFLNGSSFSKVPVKTWYLEYDKLTTGLETNVAVCQLWEEPDIDEYLKIYAAVAEPWGWTGRLTTSREELTSILHSPNNEVWLYRPNDSVIGFFELDSSIENKTEIVYVGLLPEKIGQGHGKPLLDSAISAAARNGSSVWLHSCEYDHPQSLNIYKKAGFKIRVSSINNEYYPTKFLKNRNIIS